MRLSIVVASILGWALSFSALADTIVSVKFKDYQRGMMTLNQLGIDIAGVDYKKRIVDVVTHEGQGDVLKALEVLGVELEVLNVQMKIQSAPDDKYKTPEEVTTIVKKIEADFPSLVKLSTLGTSIEGREIWVIKISDNAHENEKSEPAILFNAMHHAREVMTTEVALDIANELLTKYDTDAKVKSWVDNNEIYIVPMLNPDGNHRVWTSNNMWRKNARGDYGVDINRNYPYQWGACNGSSGFQWSDTYRGASAGSEPETKALMKLVGEIKPVFDISYHSYSELVLYPYSCEGEHVETHEIVAGLGKELASIIKSDNGGTDYEPGTSWEVLYGVDGGDIDWMYHEHGVIPYVIELNSRSAGFQPPYSLVAPTLVKQRPGWGKLLDRVSESSIRGYLSEENINASTSITVEGLGDNNYKSVHKAKVDGSFHVIVKPGMYSVTINTPNLEVIKKEVTVGKDRVELTL